MFIISIISDFDMLPELATSQHRQEWISIRRLKFLKGDDFKPRVRTETVIDAEKTFVDGLYWACILCTSVALDHLGFNYAILILYFGLFL